MKTLIKIFLLFICLFSAIGSHAQAYTRDSGIDKYVGTWEWKNGNDILQIVITKQKLLRVKKVNDNITNYYSDVAVGWHSYIKNGVSVESSMGKANTQYTSWGDAYDNSTLMGGTTHTGAFELFFKDITKNKYGSAKLEMLSGSTNEARWTLKPESHLVLVIPGKLEAPPKGFSVPTDVIMKKIK